MSGDLPPDPFADHRDDPLRDQVEHVGPFQRTYVVLNGHAVPHLTSGEAPTPGEISLVLDHRFAIDVPLAHAERIVWFIANAIAIERGYACFPRTSGESEPPRLLPFGGVWHGVTHVDREEGPS